MSIRKNVAGQKLFGVLVHAGTGAAITSDATIKIGASDGSGTLSHLAGGLWEYTLTQAETNADSFGYVFGGTNVVPVGGTVITVDYPRNALPNAASEAVGGVRDVHRVAGQVLGSFTGINFDIWFNDPNGTVSPDALANIKDGATQALSAIKLDRLILNPVVTDFATTVHVNSVIGHLAHKSASATFARADDSMEAVRDRGDAAWITGSGGGDSVWSLSQRDFVLDRAALIDVPLSVVNDNVDGARMQAESAASSAAAANDKAANLQTRVPDALVGGRMKGHVEEYAAGKDPGTYTLSNPANKIATNASGEVTTSNPGGDSVWSTVQRDLVLGKLDVSGTLAHTDNANAFKADVSGLLTTTAFGTWSGDWTAARAGFIDKLNIGENTLAHTGNANTFKASGFSTHSAADVAAAVLVTPANKIASNASGEVTTSNPGGDSVWSTGQRDLVLGKLDVSGTLAHTDNANTFKADVSGLLTATAFGTWSGDWTAARAGFIDKLNIGENTLAHTGNAGTFKADVSGLLTTTAFGTWSGDWTAARAAFIDKLDIGANTLAHTGNAGTFKADVSGVPAAVAAAVLLFSDRKITVNEAGQVVSDASFEGEISGLTPEQAKQLAQLWTIAQSSAGAKR